MSLEIINSIEDLIQLPTGKKILWHEVKPLTAPGENYGSLMLSIDLTVSTQNGTRKIHGVAKTIPPDAVTQEIFNTQVTFRNEIAFYKNIVPLLQDFQRENGVNDVINFTANCYGGRLNLKGDNGEVDSDAALVLENLKIPGYVTLKRTEGLNFDAAKLVLRNLALLHAVPLAMKLKKPEVFEEKIKPYLDVWKVKEFMQKMMRRDFAHIIDQSEQLSTMKDILLSAFDKQLDKVEPREPFATVTHNDCWTNNNMFKLENNEPVKNILLDFQTCSYGSPGKDIIFFLFSSVQSSVIGSHYDELLEFYHENFLSTLNELNCDTTPFSFEAFQKELDFEASHSQFPHVVFMLFPIFAEEQQIKNMLEFSPENMPLPEVSDLHKEKLVFIVNQFKKRNWL